MTITYPEILCSKEITVIALLLVISNINLSQNNYPMFKKEIIKWSLGQFFCLNINQSINNRRKWSWIVTVILKKVLYFFKWLNCSLECFDLWFSWWSLIIWFWLTVIQVIIITAIISFSCRMHGCKKMHFPIDHHSHQNKSQDHYDH